MAFRKQCSKSTVGFAPIWALAREAPGHRKVKTVSLGIGCSWLEKSFATSRLPSSITACLKTGLRRNISYDGGLIRRVPTSGLSEFQIPSGVSRGYQRDSFAVLQYGHFDGCLQSNQPDDSIARSKFGL